MKFQIAGIALAALTLSACFGPQGNPNGQPYADEPGGTIAVAPGSVDVETYDPGKQAPPFQDMRPGPYKPTPATPAAPR